MAYHGDLDAWYNTGYALKEQGKHVTACPVEENYSE